MDAQEVHTVDAQFYVSYPDQHAHTHNILLDFHTG